MKQTAKTILLVEDDAIFAESVSRSLKKEGYIVIQASTAKEAVNSISLDGYAIDLILMDTHFKKGIDGIQAAQEINQGHNIPIVFIINHDDKKILKKTEKTGSYGYVVKDIKNPVMMTTINVAFKLHKARQEIKENALSISEVQYRSTLNGMIDAIHVVDKNMRILLMNNAFKQWIRNLGLVVETEGKTLFEIFPFLSQEVWKEYERVFVTGELLFTEETNIVGGREYITETRKIPVYKDDNITEVITIVRDITEHKRAEEALRQSEEKYRTILESIEEGYYEVDIKGNFIFCNIAMAIILGYSKDELTGMNYRDYMRPETAKRIYSLFNEVYKTGNPGKIIDHEVIRKNGSVKMLQLSISLLRNSSGEPIGFRGITRDVSEVKIAEKALQDSEEKYRTILETMEEGLLENDLKGNYTFVNDAACRLNGYRRDELIGMNYRKLFSPETARRVREIFKKIYETGKPEFLMDYEVICKDGSVRIHESNAALLRDPSGKPIGFRNLAHDVTERRRADDALRKSEEKYRTIIESMEEGLYEIDLKGNYTFVNNAACKQLGYTCDDLTRMSYQSISSPETSRYLYEIFHRIYETGKPEFLMDYEVNRKDGSTRIHQSNAQLMRDASGKPIGFRNLARDVTDYKKVEYDLRQSEEKYRTILETMEEGLIESDLKGNCIYVNDAACKLHGYNRDEMIGMSYKKRSNPETRHLLYEVFHRIYETGKPEFLLDHEVICKDGSIRILQSNIVLMRDVSGKPIGFRALIRDVTDRKKAEEEKARIETQLFQAQKMESVGSLAGGVAHDFNNMLTVILGYTELIKSRLPQDDSLFKDILEIEKAAGRSKELTRQLLAYSRKEIIVPKLIDLNDLIVGAEKTISRLIGEDIDLRFYPRKDIWNIKFDPSQMELILINLAANARDAMPNGGKLTIETNNIQLKEEYCRVHLGFLPGDYVLLGVSDDGIGMDKETMQHVFEPFFTTKETGKGTGLGLATVYGIVKQNGGFINVYSEPGKGTSFKMYIPRSMEEGEVKKEVDEVFIASGTGTVLLVEDDDMVRKITTEMLEIIGYTTLSVGTPMEALSFFKNDDTPIDLVITDVVMPQISGKELSDRIKAIRPGIKVLFSSGYSTNVIAHQGVLEEGVHFIQKPFSLNDLARKVHEAIKDR